MQKQSAHNNLVHYNAHSGTPKTIAHDVGWGYGDQIEYFLDVAFPDMFKI
jgi:hypothetical protein